MGAQIQQQNGSKVRDSNLGKRHLQERLPIPEDDARAAALNATMFVLPLTALTSTVLLPLMFEEIYEGP